MRQIKQAINPDPRAQLLQRCVEGVAVLLRLHFGRLPPESSSIFAVVCCRGRAGSPVDSPGTIRPPDNILDPLCHARKEASALSSPPSDRQGLFPATRDSRQSSRQQINQSTERPDKNLHRTSSLRVNKQNVPINGPAHC
ncbi:hypothetical protein LSTR_LSTR003716 [Laodelphax striatellus]|uniref:Uncharacterized protein n=1 Tax=Laodelphax striatellus TaxID=195883 RepID=A0A482WZS2_LAOST|nr:hypothetical protein LSTR_LSTR003716 [Laodelphax striatellus]